MRLDDPTFWPAVEWAQAGEAAVLACQSTGVRFSSAGEVELMVVRDAEKEVCDLEGGTGTDLDPHRIEWRVERAISPAAAAQAAQAFNRPVLALPVTASAGADDLPRASSLYRVSGEGLLSTAKPADRGEGLIVRVLLVPGPLTLELPPALVGRRLTRTDAAERDLEDLGETPAQLRFDRERYGAIATVRIH